MIAIFRKFYLARSGGVAIEFAIIAPFFCLLLFGLILFSSLFLTYSSVQQLSAEAARASVAGLSEEEREKIARTFVSENVGSYPFLNPQALAVNARQSKSDITSMFEVTVTYDLSETYLSVLAQTIGLTHNQIERRSIVTVSSQN